MNGYCLGLLEEIHRLEKEHAAAGRPQGYDHGHGAAKFEWEQVTAHGPRIASLFDPGEGHTERQRIGRALRKLAALGLVELTAANGLNITHVKTTASAPADLPNPAT